MLTPFAVDLNDPLFTRPLCETFCNKVPALSRQKFSSNVIEKVSSTLAANLDTC